MISTNIKFDEKSYSDLAKAMQRASGEIGKSTEDVIKWTGNKIAVSLGAATRQSPKLRKIIKNPDKRAGKDRRVAIFGVDRYKTDGSKKFIPIYRGGEYGAGYRFISRTTGEMLTRGRDGQVHRTKFSLKEFEAAGGSGIKNSPKRKIFRRGLAKKSWRGIKNRVNSGGAVSAMDAKGIARVKHIRGSGKFGIVIINHLRYIEAALIPGSLPSTLSRAARSMEHIMEERAGKGLYRNGLG